MNSSPSRTVSGERTDDFRPAPVRQPPRLMRLRDRRDAANKRSDAERHCVRGDVGLDRRRPGGQRAAQGREKCQVRPIGPAGAVSDAGRNQSVDLVENAAAIVVQLTASYEAPNGNV